MESATIAMLVALLLMTGVFAHDGDVTADSVLAETIAATFGGNWLTTNGC